MLVRKNNSINIMRNNYNNKCRKYWKFRKMKIIMIFQKWKKINKFKNYI